MNEINSQKRVQPGYAKTKKMNLLNPQFSNNMKTVKIVTSQSQNSINSSLAQTKKMESRPNTGGSKSPFRAGPTLGYKDKSRINTNRNNNRSDIPQNDANISGNKVIDKKSLSVNKIEKNVVPGLNISSILSKPKSTIKNLGQPRDVSDKSKLNKLRASNEASLNNSTNDISTTNRSMLSRSQNNKGKQINYSKSPLQKHSEKKPPSPITSSRLSPNMKLPAKLSSNISKLKNINSLNNSQKNVYEQVEVHNNLNQRNNNQIRPHKPVTAVDKTKNIKQTLNEKKPEDDKKKIVDKKSNTIQSQENSSQDLSIVSKSNSKMKIPEKQNDNTIIKSIKAIYEVTKAGLTAEGTTKTNQDSYFIYKNFNNNPNSIFFGVCDGHGMNGHDVSGYLKEHLPVTLDMEFRKKHSNMNQTICHKIIKDVFLNMNKKLNDESNIDTSFSGSTCVTLIYTPEKLICPNVGDSRAVVGRCINGNWTAHNLSRDHKPSDPDEQQRILMRNGRIEAFRDENDEFIGPMRVWLKDEDIPGLAMSRSFGDMVAASVGCTTEPEIKEWTFTKEDMFILIASDGIWEFIESDECVNMVKDFYERGDLANAANFVVKESIKRWLKEEEVIDDISLIIIFLNH